MASAIKASVNKEQVLLEMFFQTLCAFSYDNAKDLMDKEKDIIRVQQNTAMPAGGGVGATWGMLVNCLLQLVSAEKSYSSLSFLSQNIGQKIFGRKDSMRSTLSNVQLELRRVEELKARTDLTGDTLSYVRLCAHLASQLIAFVDARLQMADFFEQLSALNQVRLINCDALLDKINDISAAHAKSFHHPVLAPLNAMFSVECDVLVHLLQCQREMLQCHFLPCLLQLQASHARLSSWDAACQTKGRKSGYGVQGKASAWPALYQWLARFQALLVAKSGLYFSATLSRQTPTPDFKNMLARGNPDLWGRIAAFQRKSDAVNVSIVFDVTSMGTAFQGIGYRYPNRITEPPRGMDCYPAIASIPTDMPTSHWPAIVSLITQSSTELQSFDRVVSFFDKGLNSTYFLTGIEPKLTLIIRFEGHKSERDSNTQTFITDLCSHLRLTKLFTSLKPGAK